GARPNHRDSVVRGPERQRRTLLAGRVESTLSGSRLHLRHLARGSTGGGAHRGRTHRHAQRGPPLPNSAHQNRITLLQGPSLVLPPDPHPTSPLPAGSTTRKRPDKRDSPK